MTDAETRADTDEPRVSALVWATFALNALSALLYTLVFLDGEGFLGPTVGVASVIAIVSLAGAIIGRRRSALRWPGTLAIVLSATLIFNPALLLSLLVYSFTS